MSEYWVSQARKFCTQCKCWITDNKASRDFHESGKKHKEAVALQLKEARKRGADVMREKDELAKTLETIEKKAKLAVMKDNIGIDELTKSSDGQNERSEPLEVSEVNKVIYAPKDTEETPNEETGLGKWECTEVFEPVEEDIDPSELPEETEEFVVKDTKYEVKTCAVIESVDIDPDTAPTTMGFKKRRARNIRKKTDT